MKPRIAIIIFAVGNASLFGQAVNPLDVGFTPTGMYQHADIDSVNTANGNAVIHIPLFSYPQFGSDLKLGFSIVANTSLWQPNTYCYPDSPICEYTYNIGNAALPGYDGNSPMVLNPCGFSPSASPTIMTMPSLSASWCQTIAPSNLCQDISNEEGDVPGTDFECQNFITTLFNVVEPTGEEHPLSYDANNSSILRTTDGSGYRLSLPDPAPYYPWTTSGSNIYWKDLQTGAVLTNSRGLQLSSTNTLKDLNGNTISGSGGSIIDTAERTIPYPPSGPTTSSTAGCPSLGAQYQAPIGSATWTVPGPNSQSMSFLLCFTNVAYQTNFWGYGPKGVRYPVTTNGNIVEEVYSESNGINVNLQSVVLPNGNYWGFTYDAANPDDATSIAYGTLTGIVTPEKSSIAYKYTHSYACGAFIDGEPVNIQRVSQRTVTDANGTAATWSYMLSFYGVSPPFDSTKYPVQDVVTDPYNNDTAYGFTLYGCQTLPAKTVHYAGSYTLNQVLRTESTAFDTVPDTPPAYAPHNGYANAFPAKQTAVDEAGNQATRTYSYDSGFLSQAPSCYLGVSYFGSNQSPPLDPYGPCTLSTTTLQLSFGLETARSLFNYDGTPAATYTTIYTWQTGTQASNLYYTGNILKLPCLQSVFAPSEPSGISLSCAIAAHTNLLAQTSYGYDTAGNRTSVSKWIGTGSQSATASIVYNANGMPKSSTDPLLNTTQFSYSTNTACPFDSAGLFASDVQQPTTNGVQHVDYYCHDANTGNLMWHTDQNGSGANDSAHTINYTYNDPLGRRTQILSPPTEIGQGETDISYNDTTRTVTTTIKASPNPNRILLAAYDSLGRKVQDQVLSDPDGVVYRDTTYDLLGRIAAESNPYRSMTEATYGKTQYFYDALDRKTKQIQADGTGSILWWCYNGTVDPLHSQTNCNSNLSSATNVSWVDSTDENGNNWQHLSDSLGRLVNVVEPENLQTTYTYDALGNLSCADQWGTGTVGVPCNSSHARSFSYDSLSRLTSSINPESGTIGYVYDVNGNLTSKTSPLSNATSGTQTINYSYDALDRLLSKTYPVLPTTSAAKYFFDCYQYDASSVSGASTAGNFVGHPTNSWTQIGSSTGSCPSSPPTTGVLSGHSVLAYDAVGNALSSQQCILTMCSTGGTPFQLSETYDLAGNPAALTQAAVGGLIPRLEFVRNYDGAGRLRNIESSWDGHPNASDPLNIFSAQSYSAAGGLQNWMVGSYLNFQKNYDIRNRPTSMVVTHP